MAQKTGKEETEFKVSGPETLILCVNNCGFTGNPSTKNMCQKCFINATAASLTSDTKVSSSETSRSISSKALRRFSPTRSDVVRRDLKVPDEVLSSEEAKVADLDHPVKREVSRCSGCRRKVGLTGFRCRCGELFCSEHRYSDRHDCNYDYKAVGREMIARENPIVKAAKIVKI